MKASQIINELKKQRKLLDEDITDEDLEKFTNFIKGINPKDIIFENLQNELEEINFLINDIISKVEKLQNDILKNIEKLQKETNAEKTYMKNEILNNR